MAHRKVSQYALAKKTGVPQPTINRILKGGSADPRSETVRPLADFFNISPEELRGTSKDWRDSTEKFTALSPDAMEILGAFARLPAERQQAFKDTLFLEVFAIEQMPWLKRGRPVKESYNEYERRMHALATTARKK